MTIPHCSILGEMDFLIRNPAGRIVSVKDEESYKQWLQKPGFEKVTSDEQTKYYIDREKKFAIGEDVVDYEYGVYISTVTQGGTDGYGIASKNILRHLTDLGAKPSLNYAEQKVGLLFHAPYSITRLETPIKLIYTMFESDKIPEEWPEYLSIADRVIVPSRWCQEVFAKSGVQTQVIPLGYDDDIYKPIQRRPRDKSKQDFVFLHYNAFNIRKGNSEVFKAFVQEFRKDEPVKLVLKTTLNQPPIPMDEYPNIEVITGKIPDEAMQKLLARADCFVFPSRGEGFGMTPLEAMATGLPTIVPNAHGHSEYFDGKYMFEAKVAEQCPALYHRYKGQDVGKMVICDVNHLRRQMRYIYEHQEHALQIGQRASEYVKQYTIKNTAKQLNELISEAKDWKPSRKNSGKILTVKRV